MLYEGKNPVLRIISIERLQWAGGAFTVGPREYGALTFRIRGTASITVDGTEYTVNPGEILYLPQGLPYTARYSDTDMVAIHFVTAGLDPVPEVYSAESTHETFLQICRLWQTKQQGYEVYALSLLYQIFGLIGDAETKNSVPSCFLEAISYIHEHFRDSALTADRICRHSGISQTAFRLLFQKHYGKTPLEYITALRLEQARNLIASGAPIETAALDSGFNDPKYFARTVKKHFGCTPRDWKTYGK